MLQAFIYGTSVSCLSILINLLTIPFRFAGLVTPFSLRSRHRLNLDESRLDWDAFSVPASHLNFFFTLRTFDEPCRWTLLHIS